MRAFFPGRSISCAIAAVLLASCGDGDARPDLRVAQRQAAAASPSVPGRAATSPTSAECPSRDFGAFLTAFAERPALQRRFTRNPLVYTYTEDGGNGPEFVEHRMHPDAARDTLFLSAAERARDTLRLRVDSVRPGVREVTLWKPDTDYQLEYTFERRADGCWELTRHDNLSP